MGLLDKAKFWKKPEEENLDFSDLGDFGLGTKTDEPKHDTMGGFGDIGDMGDLGTMPSLDEPMRSPAPASPSLQTEEVRPTQASSQMRDQLGIRPQQPAQQQTFQAAPAPQQQQQFQSQQQYAPIFPQRQQVSDIGEFAKDIEIIHAKLDSIKSSLDSINQRLATLERIASGDNTRTRYQW